MENQLAQIEQLDELDAPGWGEWVAGIGVGAQGLNERVLGSSSAA